MLVVDRKLGRGWVPVGLEADSAWTSFGWWKDGSKLLKEHQAANADSPYWQHTNRNEKLYEDYMRGDLRVRVGRIGAYTPEQMAVIVDTTTRSYVRGGLFGELPTGDPQEWIRLIGEMSGGFNNQRLVISISDSSDTRFLGGCMVVPGKSEKPLAMLVGQKEAELPTLYALDFALPPGMRGMAEAMEMACVCYTRFHRLPNEQWEFANGKADQLWRRFSMETISAMARAVSYWAQNTGREINFGILDTHDPEVVGTLIKHYSGSLADFEAVPTEQIARPNPLGWHYRPERRFAVVGFDFPRQITAATKVDRDLGQRVIYSAPEHAG